MSHPKVWPNLDADRADAQIRLFRFKNEPQPVYVELQSATAHFLDFEIPNQQGGLCSSIDSRIDG